MFGSVTDSLVARYRHFAHECEEITLVFDGGNTSAENMQAIDTSAYHFITSLTLTHHQELLAVPLRRFESFADPRTRTRRTPPLSRRADTADKPKFRARQGGFGA